MRYLALFLILLSIPALYAQSAENAAQILQLRQSLAQNPVDTGSRMSLAYLLMLSEDYPAALTQYQIVMRQDSLNAEATSGALWALAGMQDWDTILQDSQLALGKFPFYSPILNHRAYAEFYKGRHLQSRKHYAQALRHSTDQQSAAIASEGLAWEYFLLGDRYRASRFAPKELVAFHQAFRAPSVSLALDYSRSNTDLQAIAARAGLKSGYLEYRLAGEELLISGTHHRYLLSMGLVIHHPAGITGLSTSYLDGEDARAYPAATYSLSHSKAIYSGAWELQPRATAHLGTFERFNTYQADLGFRLRYQPVAFSYQYSTLYQDNESSGADRQRSLHNLSSELQIGSRYLLAAIYTQGSQGWWINPNASPVDDFDAASQSIALSLYAALDNHWAITLYHQIGLINDETRHLSNLALNYNL